MWPKDGAENALSMHIKAEAWMSFGEERGTVKEQKKRQSQRRHKVGETRERGQHFQGARIEPGTKDPHIWTEPRTQTEWLREETPESLPPERLSIRIHA